MDLIGVVSDELRRSLPAWAQHRRVRVLPVGVDTERFRPIPRAQARAELGLDENLPYLLFAADPGRREKRYDRAADVANGTRLLSLGNVEPEQVPLWVNAANAVLVTSEREGFGLAALEALACDVPVLATPCGIAPVALAGVKGAYCDEFEPARWRAVLEPLLADPDPRAAGRTRAEQYSCLAMAERQLAAWREAIEGR
jgi:glycosyltransferase involved in cell wall biosynthesis